MTEPVTNTTELKLSPEEWMSLERCLARTGLCQAAWIDGKDLAEDRIPSWARPEFDVRRECCCNLWLHEAGLYRFKGREREPLPKWEGEKKVGVIVLQHVRCTELLVAYLGWFPPRRDGDMDDFRKRVDFFTRIPLCAKTQRRRWWFLGDWGGGLRYSGGELWWVFLVDHNGQRFMRARPASTFDWLGATDARAAALKRWPSWTGFHRDSLCYHRVIEDSVTPLDVLRRTVDVKVFKLLPP